MKLKEKGSASSMADVAASGAQLAMGRVVGSICVVTARDEEAVSALIATWVSQVTEQGCWGTNSLSCLMHGVLHVWHMLHEVLE